MLLRSPFIGIPAQNRAKTFDFQRSCASAPRRAVACHIQPHRTYGFRPVRDRAAVSHGRFWPCGESVVERQVSCGPSRANRNRRFLFGLPIRMAPDLAVARAIPARRSSPSVNWRSSPWRSSQGQRRTFMRRDDRGGADRAANAMGSQDPASLGSDLEHGTLTPSALTPGERVPASLWQTLHL